MVMVDDEVMSYEVEGKAVQSIPVSHPVSWYLYVGPRVPCPPPLQCACTPLHILVKRNPLPMAILHILLKRYDNINVDSRIDKKGLRPYSCTAPAGPNNRSHPES